MRADWATLSQWVACRRLAMSLFRGSSQRSRARLTQVGGRRGAVLQMIHHLGVSGPWCRGRRRLGEEQGPRQEGRGGQRLGWRLMMGTLEDDRCGEMASSRASAAEPRCWRRREADERDGGRGRRARRPSAAGGSVLLWWDSPRRDWRRRLLRLRDHGRAARHRRRRGGEGGWCK